jgi:multiple antibiotic resistance protein
MNTLQEFFSQFDIWEVLPAFVFLIAIIDPFGNIPITINMEKRGIRISAWRVCLASLVILMAFLFAGEWILKIFGVQIEYFAIAGGFVIFLMAMEMVLDIVIFQNDKLEGEIGAGSTIVPLAFPMYAGPGAFTALLAITVDYHLVNLCIALLLCMAVLYIVLVGTHWLTKYMGNTALYIIRKFFGIIVLAIACNLMFGNLVKVFKTPAKCENEQTENTINSDNNEELLGDDHCVGE